MHNNCLCTAQTLLSAKTTYFNEKKKKKSPRKLGNRIIFFYLVCALKVGKTEASKEYCITQTLRRIRYENPGLETSEDIPPPTPQI